MGAILADRFELLSEAARGGMSTIHRARDVTTGTQVAVKLLALDRPSDVERFEREAEILATLAHPNVVRYIAHGIRRDNTRFLVQEWIEGVTLAAVLHSRGLDALEAVHMAIGVAAALGAAHVRGVIHRDVKPGNIMFEHASAEHIKLVDFGIARKTSDAKLLTRTGIAVGTPAYMSPEQARGEPVLAPATDVWSLGCVLYEAFTGCRAFDGATPDAIRAKVVLVEPTPVDMLTEGLSPELVALVHRMLSKDPQARPADGDAAALALVRALPGTVAGQRRPAVPIEKAQTRVMTHPRAARADEPRYFVFVTVPPGDDASAPPTIEHVLDIARQFDLQWHSLEDGSLLLAARQTTRPGALGAARAALAIKEQLAGCALSVFGKRSDEDLAGAIDRGSLALESALMATVFEDVLAINASIRVDDVIANLTRDEVPIVETPDGAVLQVSRGS